MTLCQTVALLIRSRSQLLMMQVPDTTVQFLKKGHKNCVFGWLSRMNVQEKRSSFRFGKHTAS